MPRNQQELADLVARDGVDQRVVDAFRTLDRADFVPDEERAAAYRDRPVPLPHGQTTSQPSLIARMVEACALDRSSRVLEVGAGYGFQTALLARLAAEVVALERFPDLGEAAARNLAAAGIDNARVIVGDGWAGSPEAAPYDAIVVAAAADEVPRALVEQLAEGGRLVIPVRRRGSDDVLVFRKVRGGLEKPRLLTPARFVPLVRGDR